MTKSGRTAFLCAALLSLFCLGALPAGEKRPVVLKYSATCPSQGILADGCRALGRLIKEESQGRLVSEFYPSAQLGDKIASMEGLAAGTIEMMECASTDLNNYDPFWSVLSLPYLWDSPEQAIKTLTDPEVRGVLEANAADIGFVVIAWYKLGARSVINTLRPVYTPADMNGLRIRVMEDPVQAATINAMGGSATPMPWSEVYTALQQGTIQGLENTEPVITGAAMQEVAKFMSFTQQFSIPDVTLVSRRIFDRLPKEDQNALREAGRKVMIEWDEKIFGPAMDQAIKNMEAAGVKFNEVDKPAFARAVRPVVDNFLKTANAEQKALYDLLAKIKAKY
ncbi:MAG: TRAP transporter substrate-binding protein DctP [Planctomycetota bacterium]|jgi:tripartite ATP-independent transporter DctP family solute receptor|nr:TRAP transporter substrate-binding protein DctP [Planctomycetota bacterium]